MDKLVKRVTVVQGGEHPQATIVYEKDEEDNEEQEQESFLRPLERAVRHMLKAELIMAQEAYERHVKSAARGKDHWLLDAPSNLLNAHRKGLKEVRKAASEHDEDEDE
jgi:hypothetical protein